MNRHVKNGRKVMGLLSFAKLASELGPSLDLARKIFTSTYKIKLGGGHRAHAR